jgi:anti-sigma B factor antagonist
MRDLIDKKTPAILVDLSGVPYLDSAALGVFVDAIRRIREYNGALGLCGATAFVQRTFEITRLVKVFNLYPTLREGITRIKETGSAIEASETPS